MLDFKKEFDEEKERLLAGWMRGETKPTTVILGLTALKREARIRDIPFSIPKEIVDRLRKEVLREIRSLNDDDIVEGADVLHDFLYVVLPQPEARLVLAYGWRPTNNRPVLPLYRTVKEAKEGQEKELYQVLSVRDIPMSSIRLTDVLGRPLSEKITSSMIFSENISHIVLTEETDSHYFASISEDDEI